MPVSPVALCRTDAREQILTQVNAHGAHGRIALTVIVLPVSLSLIVTGLSSISALTSIFLTPFLRSIIFILIGAHMLH